MAATPADIRQTFAEFAAEVDALELAEWIDAEMGLPALAPEVRAAWDRLATLGEGDR